MYLLKFCRDENFYDRGEFEEIVKLGEEIGAMLWRLLRPLQ